MAKYVPVLWEYAGAGMGKVKEEDDGSCTQGTEVWGGGLGL